MYEPTTHVLRGILMAVIVLSATVGANAFPGVSGEATSWEIRPARTAAVNLTVVAFTNDTEMREVVQAAVYDWNTASEVRLTAEGLNRTPNLRLAFEGRGDVYVHFTSAAYVACNTPAGHEANGVAQIRGNVTNIKVKTGTEDRTYGPQEMQVLVRHELGHALGANHQPVTSSWVYLGTEPAPGAQG